jgi:hypothetical protein
MGRGWLSSKILGGKRFEQSPPAPPRTSVRANARSPERLFVYAGCRNLTSGIGMQESACRRPCGAPGGVERGRAPRRAAGASSGVGRPVALVRPSCVARRRVEREGVERCRTPPRGVERRSGERRRAGRGSGLHFFLHGSCRPGRRVGPTPAVGRPGGGIGGTVPPSLRPAVLLGFRLRGKPTPGNHSHRREHVRITVARLARR